MTAPRVVIHIDAYWQGIASLYRRQWPNLSHRTRIKVGCWSLMRTLDTFQPKR